MPRPLDADYPGATHHVFVRGVARAPPLPWMPPTTSARSSCSTGDVAVRAHLPCVVLPPESFPPSRHLELGNVSSAMHWLGTCTAQSFNQRYERRGTSSKDDSGSRIVEDDDYLLELARYCRSTRCGPALRFAGRLGMVELRGHGGAEDAPSFLSWALCSACWDLLVPTSSGSTRAVPHRLSTISAGRSPRTRRHSRRSCPTTRRAQSHWRISGTATASRRSQGTSASAVRRSIAGWQRTGRGQTRARGVRPALRGPDPFRSHGGAIVLSLSIRRFVMDERLFELGLQNGGRFWGRSTSSGRWRGLTGSIGSFSGS